MIIEPRNICKARRCLYTSFLALCSLLFLIYPFTSCSEWNTESIGINFHPANSQVRSFTHLVYVEYSESDVRVWGPAQNEVVAQIDGLHVTIDNTQTDSLALFVVGYSASLDTLGVSDASITIRSSSPYALYLGGCSLRSQNGVVINSLGESDCHVVISNSSRNRLYGSLQTQGRLTLSGTGSLTIESESNCIMASSLQCQYGVSVNLCSLQGCGIYLTDGPMRSTLGTWRIDSEHDAIYTPDSIHLLKGSYYGTSVKGSFLGAPAVLRCPTLVAVSAIDNDIVDSTLVMQRYDSVQFVWQQRIDTLCMMADTTYQIRRNSVKTVLSKFTARQTMQSPCLLFSHSSFLAADTLHISKN